MKTMINLAYGVTTGIALLLLIVTGLATLMRGDNLFGYVNFWAMFVPVAGIALFLNIKRGEY